MQLNKQFRVKCECKEINVIYLDFTKSDPVEVFLSTDPVCKGCGKALNKSLIKMKANCHVIENLGSFLKRK
jgi:hypothetical protein